MTLKATLLAAALLLPFSAQAQIALSANDGKQPHLGDLPKESDVTADTVSVIDLNHYPPRILGSVDAPNSMIGPPTSLAVSHDNKFAIVTQAQKFDPADHTKFVPGNTVSVIDLTSPQHPAVIQTITAGDGATGVCINKSDTLALVANVKSGTLSVFSIANKTLTKVADIPLGAKGAGDVAISPDGTFALVTERSGTHIWRLSIAGDTVKNTGIAIETGVNPYGLVISRDGKFAFNTNLGGPVTPPDPSGKSGPKDGTVTAIDLATNTVANSIDVGATPEHVALSPDGKYMEVTVVNGSSAQTTAPAYHPFGLMKIYRLHGGTMTEAAETQTGQWGQGAVFSKDDHVILLQGAIAKNIEVYRFDGKTLTRDPAATLTFNARPGTLSTSLSR